MMQWGRDAKLPAKTPLVERVTPRVWAMSVAVKVDADSQLVYKGDRAVLQRQYVLMTIIGIKDMVKCEEVTRGQSDTAWGKLSHIRNRSTPQEVRQAEFIKQQGGAFITVRF